MARCLVWVLCPWLTVACSDGSEGRGGGDAPASTDDSIRDASVSGDAAPTNDARVPDAAAVTSDAALPDAAAPDDAAAVKDAGASSDAGGGDAAPRDDAGDAGPCGNGEALCDDVCCQSDEACHAGVCRPLCGGTQACGAGDLCRYDTCVPDLGGCVTSDDCAGDSYCDAAGECIPFGVPPEIAFDPTCRRLPPPAGEPPTVQCAWSGPPSGDPTEGSVNVYTTPIVADLGLDLDPALHTPSVVVTTWESVGGVRTGTLRVFDGLTCEEQMHIGGDDDADEGDRPAYGTQWAVGDLDGDVAAGGHPEIIGLHRTSSVDNSAPLELYALRVDTSGAQPALERMWYGRDCADGTPQQFGSNTANYGPGLWDLDDDGTPEILIDSMVFSADGCLLSDFEDFAYIAFGRINLVADVDEDAVPELVMADRIAQWSGAGWSDEAYFIPDAARHAPGNVAVADLGQYSALAGMPTPNGLPEVVVVSAETTAYDPNTSGSVRVQTLDGTVVWGPVPLYFTSPETAGGHGGPPTVADFDGDGQAEVAVAANQYFAVYDPDCDFALAGSSPPERPGGICVRDASMAALPDGILWARLSQDRSSSATGASAFDFDADGIAEAVYGDECYLRVYDGRSGDVRFSVSASNGTGYELPVVADADGDFSTEIVVARSPRSGCPSPDPLWPASGDATSAGGFLVLRESQDRWAPARPIWHQHAYQPAEVNDDATLPATHDVPRYWQQPQLNGFRFNASAASSSTGLWDLTIALTDIDTLCEASGGTQALSARVCNRGTSAAPPGVEVQFEENADLDAGPGTGTALPLCAVRTAAPLQAETCVAVSCQASVTTGANIFARVDPTGEVPDCHPSNGHSAALGTLCGWN